MGVNSCFSMGIAAPPLLLGVLIPTVLLSIRSGPGRGVKIDLDLSSNAEVI
jgi:hypothetical protein